MKKRGSELQRRDGKKERAAAGAVRLMGFAAAGAVGAITFYLICKGLPFLLRTGAWEMLFQKEWEPLGESPQYGVGYMVGATLLGSLGAMALAFPMGVLVAVYLTELAPGWLKDVMGPTIEILAGIPSILYGLLGLIFITPFLCQIEELIYKGREGSHIFSGGANLAAAVLVLAAMVLPTVIAMSQTAIKAVPKELKDGAVALGATRLQTAFGVTLRSARKGLFTTALIGLGRALGETMAVSLVAGGRVGKPAPFSSVRFLTTALVSEMGYAQGSHRDALFAIGLILYGVIMALMGAAYSLQKQ